MTDQDKSRYLEFLPAIYREKPLLGRFLVPFETVLTGFDDLLATIDRYFTSALTDSDFLPWLATWVALVLDEDWNETQKRRLISEAVNIYRWRGTLRGMKRYLEIYTGLAPEIREWRWPGGMQIGVASSIGGITPSDASLDRIEQMERSEPLVYYDYYIVDTFNSQGKPLRLYYRADRIDKVMVGDDFVDIWRFPPEDGPSEKTHHEPATITRRDGLVDEQYTLTLRTEPEPETVDFFGDTFLIDEETRVYSFVVDVRVPVAEIKNVKLNKVRAIVDLEKPAHTIYYLKLTPVVSVYVLTPMQIEVRSTIGTDTIVG
jgi:phage tail-like protein